MRLLLDEMISPRIARELRKRGRDVVAVKQDRPDLQSRSDLEIVRQMAAERRAIVTNDVADFQPIHDRLLVASEDHYGMVFSSDTTLPRNKAGIQTWVSALAELLDAYPADEALRNRVRHIG